TALGKSEAIGKFFNLDPKEGVRIDCFDFSFGQKNGPGLHIDNLIEKNPDLIFLIRESIECHTQNWYLERFDETAKEHRRVYVEGSSGYDQYLINKPILEKYEKMFPNRKPNENHDWEYFFGNFEMAAEILAHANQYQDMVTPMTEDDFLCDDFSHLERDDE